MKYTRIELQDFLENKTAPQEKLDDFKNKLDGYLSKVLKQKSEEYQKNELSKFLNNCFDYELNTKDNIDLAIYDQDEVKCFFEVKSQSNEAEFPKNAQSLESKAFYEALLYYLREKQHNNNIQTIILTNTLKFFLIQAKELEIIAKNQAIKKAYKNCDEKLGNDTSTAKFYDEVGRILPTLDSQIKFSTFEISQNLSPQEIALIFHALAPYCLLGIEAPKDSNTLNERFYKELLYILGLDEQKQNGKILIFPSGVKNSLSYAIAQSFDLNLENDFEQIFELITIWNNRILFLRLLESMLKSFKHFEINNGGGGGNYKAMAS